LNIAKAFCTPKASACPTLPPGRHPVLLLFDRNPEPSLQGFSGAFADIDSMVCYAMKANSNQAVLKTLAQLGSGVDVVSEGELRRALAAGIPASKIMFSGVGKTAREMDAALAADIYCFNIESEPELEVLNARALAMGKVAPISFRINPDVDAKTHAKISTGKKEDKFGISWQRAQEVYRHAASLKVSGSPASTCISAARSPNCSPSTTRSS
jgi:diaminopimelate decarboxylase